MKKKRKKSLVNVVVGASFDFMLCVMVIGILVIAVLAFFLVTL